MKRSITATLLIVLLVGQMIVSDYTTVQSAYSNGMNPGMAIRLEQKSVDKFKNAMQQFLPKYVEHDMKLPTEYSYKIGFLADVFTWTYKWTNIKYSTPTFDIKDIKFQLNRMYEQPMIKIDFPALKEWKITAIQESNSWILPDFSKVELEFQDFDFDFNCDLALKPEGYLDPVVYAVDIKFGNSYFYHDNAIVSFVMHQFIEFAIVIIENSVYFVGQYIFNGMIGPILTEFLNNYQLNLNIPAYFPGAQTASADVTIDYRNTMTPYIGEGYIDLFFLGEMIYNGQGCELENDPMDFLDEQMSQLVISESAMTCILNQYAKSPIGYFNLNEERWNRLWNVRGQKLDIDSVAEHIPLFKNKLGGGNTILDKKNGGSSQATKNLQIDFTFRDINVMFGQFDTDVVIEYQINLGFMDDNTGEELLYDEIRMVTSADIEAQNDIVMINLLNNKIDTASHFGNKKLPIRNSMDMTENDYREFLSTLGFTLNYLKKWLNDVVLRNGIIFPFNTHEFDTSLKFQEKSMHVIIEVEDDAQEFFENEFWDDPFDWGL